MVKITVITNVTMHGAPTPVHAMMVMSWVPITGHVKVHVIYNIIYIYTCTFKLYACILYMQHFTSMLASGMYKALFKARFNTSCIACL